MKEKIHRGSWGGGEETNNRVDLNNVFLGKLKYRKARAKRWQYTKDKIGKAFFRCHW